MSLGDVFAVDDNPDNLALLAGILRGVGYQVRLANSGRRALSAIAARPPELILLDINMPELNGYEVCKELKANEVTRDIPVIFLSALDDVRDKITAFFSGGVDYITKPFQPEEVLARVQTHLRLNRLQRELIHKNAELERRQRALIRAWGDADGVFLVLADLLPGRVLGGRYRLDEKIGSGGFAAIYRGRDLQSERDVAIKILRPSRARSGAEEREEASAARVQHPNAVEVLDSGRSENDIPWLVMELLSGHTLQEELAASGRLSVERAAELLLPVCDALAAAHAAGVQHRDVKPSNVLLHREGAVEIVKLVDFGIAKVETEEVTSTGSRLLGTPRYMSPERLLGQPYDHRADVYSFGAMAFELLSGRTPFDEDGSGLGALIMRMVETPPQPLSELGIAVPADLERLVMACLAKEPDARPELREVRPVLHRIVLLSAAARRQLRLDETAG